MSRVVVGVGLALHAVACAPEESCPTWSETKVTNPDGGAPADMVATVESTLAAFASTSGRPGACLTEIRLVPEIPDEEAPPRGRFHREGWIDLDYTQSPGEVVTRHELCHAVDYVEGWASLTHPDLFGGDSPTEAFAVLCQKGPRNNSLLGAFDASCPAGAEALVFVNTLAYPDAEVVDVPPVGTVDVALDRRAVTGLPDEWDFDPVVAAGAIWAVGYGTSWTDQHLIHVDPVTAVASTLELPTSEQVLLAESDAALVVIAADGAWRLEDDLLTWETLDVPAWEGVDHAVVLDGALWVLGASFERIDLVTGDVVAFDPPNARSYRLDGSTLLAFVREESVVYWERFDPAVGTWVQEPDPDGWRALDRATLTDGRELAVWESYALGLFDVVSLAVRDTETGGWWNATSPCTTNTLGLSTRLLMIDGQPWVWEFSNGWIEPPYPGHTLTRVTVATTEG